jgi:hypothetical protein
MYGRGHVHTTHAPRASASDWYRKIEMATLARLEARWPEKNTTAQETPIDLTTQRDSNHSVTNDSITPCTRARQ